MLLGFVATLCTASNLACAQDQYPTAEVPTSEPAYLAKVRTAAPEPIVSDAAIIMMQEGKSRELQAGSNGFTCLISPDGISLCTGQNAMARFSLAPHGSYRRAICLARLLEIVGDGL
jgi:hypothetical protein